jgi:hypothetical protein
MPPEHQVGSSNLSGRAITPEAGSRSLSPSYSVACAAYPSPSPTSSARDAPSSCPCERAWHCASAPPGARCRCRSRPERQAEAPVPARPSSGMRRISSNAALSGRIPARIVSRESPRTYTPVRGWPGRRRCADRSPNDLRRSPVNRPKPWPGNPAPRSVVSPVNRCSAFPVSFSSSVARLG